MSMTDENDLHWTEDDGVVCARCGERHWERLVGGDFAQYCAECATRKCVCGDQMARELTRKVNGRVYCLIAYGAHKGELCECYKGEAA